MKIIPYKPEVSFDHWLANDYRDVAGSIDRRGCKRLFFRSKDEVLDLGQIVDHVAWSVTVEEQQWTGDCFDPRNDIDCTLWGCPCKMQYRVYIVRVYKKPVVAQ
jgi:hypothetical protein